MWMILIMHTKYGLMDCIAVYSKWDHFYIKDNLNVYHISCDMGIVRIVSELIDLKTSDQCTKINLFTRSQSNHAITKYEIKTTSTSFFSHLFFINCCEQASWLFMHKKWVKVKAIMLGAFDFVL